MNKTELQKETAIHNEQQPKDNVTIINDIIKILVENNLTITDSKDILHETSKAICRQKITFPTITSGWINANDYRSTTNN